eukprot:scaffold1535_cov382-Prasinococcus_capsulatus_cf.AAC.52
MRMTVSPSISPEMRARVGRPNIWWRSPGLGKYDAVGARTPTAAERGVMKPEPGARELFSLAGATLVAPVVVGEAFQRILVL